MSTESDKLGDLVNTIWPATITQIDDTLTKLNTQKTELIAQRDAIDYAMDEFESIVTTQLGTKGLREIHYGTSYGVTNIDHFGGILDSWTGGNYSATYVSVDSFTVTGDQTSVFVSGKWVRCDCGVDGYKYREISSSSYVTETTVTLVADAGQNLTSNLTQVDLTTVPLYRSASYSSATQFKVTGGDYTSEYSTNAIVMVDCGGNGKKIRKISGSSFDSTDTVVTCVADDDEPLQSGVTESIIINYAYEETGWDSDTTISNAVDGFDDAYEHVYGAIGTDGTYNLQEQIDGIDLAITVQTNDKTAYQNFITIYAPFAT